MSLSIFIFGVLCLVAGFLFNESLSPAYSESSKYRSGFKIAGNYVLVVALIAYALIIYFWG